MAKCKDCIYWDDSEDKCDVDSIQDDCESFERVLSLDELEFLDFLDEED